MLVITLLHSFFDHQLLLHDLKIKNMIGLGNQVRDLYRFQKHGLILDAQSTSTPLSKSINNVVIQSIVIPFTLLYHFRL